MSRKRSSPQPENITLFIAAEVELRPMRGGVRIPGERNFISIAGIACKTQKPFSSKMGILIRK